MRRLILTIPLTLCICELLFCQTQAEMNREAEQALKEADAELNQVYQQILKEYQEDTIFIEALRGSQRNWLAFRDSEVKMKYPDRELPYGSVHLMCVAYYISFLTKQRIATLTEWIKGTEEGDVCAGTVRWSSDNE